MQKYIQISRYEIDSTPRFKHSQSLEGGKFYKAKLPPQKRLLGSYTQPFDQLQNAIAGEFDAIENMEPGTEITLEVIEMSKEDYDNLPEFTGY